jgi:hypothetical protein
LRVWKVLSWFRSLSCTTMPRLGRLPQAASSRRHCTALAVPWRATAANSTSIIAPPYADSVRQQRFHDTTAAIERAWAIGALRAR